MRKRLSIILMIVGIFLLIYPSFDNIYSWYWQQKLYKEWEQSEAIDPVNVEDNQNVGLTAEESMEELNEAFQSHTDTSKNPLKTLIVSAEEPEKPEKKEASTKTTTAAPKKNSKTATKKSANKMNSNMLGIISIKSIDVKLPILEGATNKNMRVGAGHITGTAKLGGIGNAAIAAHRSRTYGRFFNRLGEVKIGDKIVVQDKEHTYTYTVYRTKVVKPNDVSILNGNKSDKVLTLVTCTPIDTATHRLIVQAKME